MYYRVFDTQRGCYFATGYNATSMKELISDFKSYIGGALDAPSRMSCLNSWKRIEDWLQGCELEKSKTKFED